MSTRTRIAVDPVVLSCAVRYALGRLSYLPGLIDGEVRRLWSDLDDSDRDVIHGDIAEWLADDWRHDTRPGFKRTVTVWADLLAWIERQET